MTQAYEIHARLPDLNDYIAACRTHPQAGAKMKKTAQTTCEFWIKMIHKSYGDARFEKPVWITYRFYDKNRRRDKSNVAAFAIKVIEDALVTQGVLIDDGWKYIDGIEESFAVDSDHPRISVLITDELEVVK